MRPHEHGTGRSPAQSAARADGHPSLTQCAPPRAGGSVCHRVPAAPGPSESGRTGACGLVGASAQAPGESSDRPRRVRPRARRTRGPHLREQRPVGAQLVLLDAASHADPLCGGQVLLQESLQLPQLLVGAVGASMQAEKRQGTQQLCIRASHHHRVSARSARRAGYRKAQFKARRVRPQRALTCRAGRAWRSS